jgi:hypothetical protein
MKDEKFKSLKEDPSRELDQKILQSVLPELERNQKASSLQKAKRGSLSWILSGLAVASLAGILSFRLWFKGKNEQDPANVAGFDVLDLGSDIDLADFDEDFELFLDEDFESLLDSDTKEKKES